MNKYADALPFNIYCIDIDYIRPRLACSYLVINNGKAVFIDCGTSRSVPRLLATLDSCGLTPADVLYVIPTHIHLDHAGGAGLLMQECPKATLIVHPSGAKHLAEPRRLIESTSQVYGQELFDSLYGEIIPVDEKRIVSAEDNSSIDLNSRPLLIAHTPGHARHHFCIYDQLSHGWFTGDTFGLSYPDISIQSGRYLLPTTTPVQFEPEAWQLSIQHLLANNPQRMYLTHYGVVENVPALANKLSKDITMYSEIAYATQHEDHRLEQLIEKLSKYTLNDLRKLGNQQEERLLLELLNTDITLNAQGLDIWLKRQEKSS